MNAQLIPRKPVLGPLAGQPGQAGQAPDASERGPARRGCGARVARRVASVLPLLLVQASSTWAFDLKGLADPTRPPAGVMQLSASGVPAGGAVAAAAASAASAPTAIVPQRLQAIRVDPHDGHGVALIDAQLVELGGHLPGGWTLVALNAQGVDLRGPTGVLHLGLLGVSAADHSASKARHVIRKEAI